MYGGEGLACFHAAPPPRPPQMCRKSMKTGCTFGKTDPGRTCSFGSVCKSVSVRMESMLRWPLLAWLWASTGFAVEELTHCGYVVDTMVAVLHACMASNSCLSVKHSNLQPFRKGLPVRRQECSVAIPEEPALKLKPLTLKS